jgi:hypothetical protein
MKKPINRVAIIFWVLAVAYPIFGIASALLLNALRQHTINDPMLPQANAYFAFSTILVQLRASVLNFAILAGMGYLIELADQIRWSLREKADAAGRA